MSITLTIIVILAGLAAGMWIIAAASAEIERRHERWLWAHPPEEGVCEEDRDLSGAAAPPPLSGEAGRKP